MQAMSTPRAPDLEERHGTEAPDTLVQERVKRPPLYRVLLHNDDFTTRDFVVMVLVRYFYKPHEEATRIMLDVHVKGMGVAGVYPRDIAASKVEQVERHARQQEMPLRLSMEPDDPADD